MRPNTPHCVVTFESAICTGGHLYASSTICDSCYGYLHAFVVSTLLTNTEHTTEAQLLLRRLVDFYWRQYQRNAGGASNAPLPNK
jgi:hypothetical protein